MDYRKYQAQTVAPKADPGDQIVVIGGKYEKCYGYINRAKGRNGMTVFYMHCLLVDANDQLHPVRLSKFNVKRQAHNFVPSTVFEAGLIQVPKLEKKFRDLARTVASVYNFQQQKAAVVDEASQYLHQVLGEAFDDMAHNTKWFFVDETKVVGTNMVP